jgi:hypothetical protein
VHAPWSKTYVIKCPDGTIRIVHKRIDDAFPLYVHGTQTKVSARASDGLGAMSAGVDAQHQSQVQALLVAIDSKNNALMEKFRGAYSVYETNPCAQAEYFAEQVKSLIAMHDRLTEVEIGSQALIQLIRAHPTNETEIYSLFSKLLDNLGTAPPKLAQEAAKAAIAEARKQAKEWIDSADEPSVGG